MIKKNKSINNYMRILVQVIILFIIGLIFVLNYYKSKETEYSIKMEENVQQVYEKVKDDLYDSYGLLKAIIYDLETASDFPESSMYPIVKEYFSRNPQIKKVTFSDKNGKIISSIDSSGLDVSSKYKGKPIGSSLTKINSDINRSDIDIEMKQSIYSYKDVDTLYPVYKNRNLLGFFSITTDVSSIFSKEEFKIILEKNDLLVTTSDGKTIFKSKGFNGNYSYTSKIKVEDINWIIKIESKEDVLKNAMKKVIFLSLGLIALISFVIYLEWQLLDKGAHITELTRLQEEIKKIAYSDSLTGLHNRLSITNQISSYIKNSKKHDECAVIFLDLDDFKNVNDIFGHEKGDKLLKSVAEIFKKISSKDERIITSRIGGDEFITLFKNIKSEDEIHQFCREILSKLNNMFNINNKEINISASIGVSFFPKSGVDVNTLFKNADMAMYDSKAKGKNQYSFFGDEMGRKIQRKALIESRLKTLINNNDFTSFSILYQPQIPISKKTNVKMAEALTRWNDKELGCIYPSEFIQMAENTGTIDELGNWVLKESCRYLKKLESELKIKQNISINISPKQFRDWNFVNKIIATVKEEGVLPAQITLEITEQVFIDNIEDCIKILIELKSAGFKISLDDFGTGYSSLSYLSKLPIDILKIDKSFVDNIESNVNSLSLIKGIIQLSHSINLEIVVEGVETYGQYKLLKELGADVIQGYYFSRPLSEEDYIIFSKSNFLDEENLFIEDLLESAKTNTIKI